ncbi:putative uncharacterized protein C5orf58 homolog isoform X2 [Nannospalax galili]|nr:putative uncharacterized protein C5orf58 homolog isoform X2 [Nannospalax galili]
MLKNDNPDHKQKVEAIIKNINTISLEMKKMRELSELLLCDLNLHFGQPMKTEDPEETQTTNLLFQKPKIPDVALASLNFSD